LATLSELPEKEIDLLKRSFAGEDFSGTFKKSELKILASKELGSIAVFGHLFDKILGKKIEKRYFNALKSIVINKIFEPCSKNAISNWMKNMDFDFSISNRNDFYEALDYLEEKQEEIEKKLLAEKGKLSLLLYDITSTYFEGKGAENLCKYGYSRDHRSDRMQVNIGLVCNEAGFPISVEIMAGNITDKQTVKDKIDALKKKFKIEKVCFVFDRGMKSESNLKYIEESGYQYITCLSHAQLRQKALENKNIQQSIFDKEDLARFEITEKEGKRVFVLCHNPMKKEKDSANRLALLSRTEADLKKIQALKRVYTDLEIQNKLSKKINAHHCEKYLNYEIKEGRLSFSRNTEKLENDAQYDGFFMIESSQTEMKAQEMEDTYKSLQIVERAFDDVKNHLQIRPVFHYKEERIKGHIFSCFLSYHLLHQFRIQCADLLKKYSLNALLTELTRHSSGLYANQRLPFRSTE
jgi:transposase